MRFAWTRCYLNTSEFKYLGYVLEKSGTDEAECSRKVGRRVEGAIRPLANARGLRLECAWVFHASSYL